MIQSYANRKVVRYNYPFNLGAKAVKRGSRYIYEDIITLDTETSYEAVYDVKGRIDKANTNAWVYQWAICTRDAIVNGDTIDELIIALDYIANNSLYGTRKIYVHNLGYDATYIVQACIEKYGTPKVIATDKHKDISLAFSNNLTFVCSYRLSNKSLDKWSKDLNTVHKKKIGFVDYEVKHYPHEERTEKDNIYMWHDVVAQYECIRAQLDLYGDNMASVPLTSTGYVRRLVRNSYRQYNLTHNDEAYKEFTNSAINPELYEMLRMEFQGALTHGNRFYANKIVHVNKRLPYGKHRDFDSHYPTQLITKKYPRGNWLKLYDRSECKKSFTVSMLEKEINDDKAVLFMCEIKNLELRDARETLPYAQECKFRENHKMYGIYDNGRIIKQNGGSIVTLNDVDYKILKRQYTFKILIMKVYTCNKDYLPTWLTDVIKELYKQKNELKKIVKQIEKEIKEGKEKHNELYEAQLNLLKSKELLNSIYGMSATQIVRTSYEMDENGEYIPTQGDTAETLKKYYKSRNNCLQYAVGTYCTSYARMELLNKKYIIEDHGGIFLYGDTDSIFYLSNDEVEKALNEDDERRLQYAKDHNFCVVLDNGDYKYFDKFDSEPDYTAFKFLHAKCYGTIDMVGNLDITVAGVRRRECIGIDENEEPIFITREEELKDLKNLKKGTKFKKCGGTSITYINKPLEVREINGRKIKCGNCAIISKVDKTLSEYSLKEVLENVTISGKRVYI